jgi:predicted ATPase/DNA-binding SARP family transcriptional activator
MVTMYLLGAADVAIDNQPINKQISQKALGLFIYVAQNPGLHNRDFLANLFWGDMSDELARKNLRMALSNLRKVVADYLVVDRQNIGFNFLAPHFFDTIQLRQIAQDPRQSLAAAELYRGHFLTGFSANDAFPFLEWLEAERRIWQDFIEQVLQRGLELLISEQQYTTAITIARRLLALDPTAEETHRQLMRLLALAGQFNTALEQFSECQQILKTQLGVDVMPETLLLRDRILQVRTTAQNNLPQDQSLFIGRALEQNEVCQRLLSQPCRLVTILGSGGVGKTQLALHVARQLQTSFLEGVYLVQAQTLETSAELIAAIAESVGCVMREQRPLPQLLEFLRNRELLLLCDNFEQLGAAGGAVIHQILANTTHVKVLITSRERLGLIAEWVQPLAGLAYPLSAQLGNLATPATYSGVQLFRERARQFVPDFVPTDADYAAIAQICELTAGLPLAIELAAAWVRVLSCTEIATELQRNFALLESGTGRLRAVFSYSWERLTDTEKLTFQKLAVFAGDFDRRAAQAVAEATLMQLSDLVDKSLLQLMANKRYRLHPVLRQYALAILQGSVEHYHNTRYRHCSHYCEWLGTLLPDLHGPPQIDALRNIENEWQNIQFAWEWLALPGLGQLPVPLVTSTTLLSATQTLFWFSWMRQRWQDGIQLFTKCFANIAPRQPTDFALWGFLAAASAKLMMNSDQISKARQLAQNASAALPELVKHATYPILQILLVVVLHPEDTQQRLNAIIQQLEAQNDRWGQGWALYYLGEWYIGQADRVTARSYLQQALTLFQVTGDRWWQTRCFIALAGLALYHGEAEQAQILGEQGLNLAYEFHSSQLAIGSLNELANIALANGKYQQAESYQRRAMEIARQAGDREWIANSLNSLGHVLLLRGNFQDAEQYYQESLNLGRAIGKNASIAWALQNLGDVQFRQENYLDAAAHYQACLALFQQEELALGATVTFKKLANVQRQLADYNLAAANYQQALQQAKHANLVTEIPEILLGWAENFMLCENWYQGILLVQTALNHPNINQNLRRQAERLLAELLLEALPPDLPVVTAPLPLSLVNDYISDLLTFGKITPSYSVE